MTTRTFSFRSVAFALIASVALFATPALGQSSKQSPQSNAIAATVAVPAGECGAFIKYMTQEARDFGDKLSATFLENSLRFMRAGCRPLDKDGEIQIITTNRQDAVSLGTALSRMGTFDILGVSGIKHCHRPQGGSCTIATGSNASASPRS